MVSLCFRRKHNVTDTMQLVSPPWRRRRLGTPHSRHAHARGTLNGCTSNRTDNEGNSKFVHRSRVPRRSAKREAGRASA